MKIIADAACNILYASYYLYGLQQFFGKKVCFKAIPFKELTYSKQYLAIILDDDIREYKIIIDFNNRKDIIQSNLDWCDVYGKVNLAPEDHAIPKVMAIGPLTAIKCYTLPLSCWYAISNYWKSRKKVKGKKMIRAFFSDYKAQYQRPSYGHYQVKSAKSQYAFFAASLWKDEPEANQFRANFITACYEIPEVQFEGGFAPRSKNDMTGFEAQTMLHRVSYQEFSQKTEDSTFVFNTPTIGGCNGWRLAEYLAMGKVIISTSLVRLLPKEFEDEKEVLWVSGSLESIKQAIKKLLASPVLQKKLSENSCTYFHQYLAPHKVIERLYSRINNNFDA